MIKNDYSKREEFANIRRIGDFDKPNPENYLGNYDRDASIANHPAKGKKIKKHREPLEAEEVVNIFRLVMLFVGIISIGVGIGLWLSVALGLVAFGLFLWVTGMWIISRSNDTTQNNE